MKIFNLKLEEKLDLHLNVKFDGIAMVLVPNPYNLI